jgi:hypothetical protein
MTFEQAFKRIKTKFGNVNASKLEDMAIQITFSDEDCGGTFYAAVKNGVLEVEPYDYKDNDAVIDVTRTALASILDGKSSIEKEIEKGTLSVKGNLEKVAAVKEAIVVPVKKPATRKTSTAKKTTVKKPSTKKTAAKKTADVEKEDKKPVVKKSAIKKAPTAKTTKE